MEQYLRVNHSNDIINLMNNPDENSSTPIFVDLNVLYESQRALFNDIVNNVHEESIVWSQNLFELQKEFAQRDEFLSPNYQIKVDSRVRFNNLPQQDIRNRSTFPTKDDVGQFVQIKGTVVRCTQPKFLEHKKNFNCGHCNERFTIVGEYEKHYALTAPTSCSDGCKGRLYSDTTNFVSENFMNYQEIKIMEFLSNKSMPSVMTVTLDNDLVESCQPSASVIICGTVESRWCFAKKLEITLVIRAHSVSNKMEELNMHNELPEHLICLRAEWDELTGKFGELCARDIIIQSICPDVHGMYLAKLAIILSICSGSNASSTVSGMRNHSHVLLLGDPGLAKSRLLKFATLVTMRSSFVIGSGCSLAGLTAAAVQENGEWHLEAGALPLADNAICCIDEFNMMSESDKASLHEAMEQQTIHIAKAGIACKMNTRCSVIAATNPKNIYSTSGQEGTSNINLGLASSLLSRFDLVLILRDERNTEWETTVANHILFATGPERHEDTYDVKKLQAHFAAVRDFEPKVGEAASRILKAYYLACRADQQRNAGRTTLRLNDSLYRLAKAHAKLLFRNEVHEVDAALAVYLMESSFGFGRILEPMNVLRQNFPIGPSEVQIRELMDRLHLERNVPGGGDNNPSQNHTSNTGNILREDTARVSQDVVTNVQLLNANTFDYQSRPGMTTNQESTCRIQGITSKGIIAHKSANTIEENRSSEVTLQFREQGSRMNVETISPLQKNDPKPSTSHGKRVHNDFRDGELEILFRLDCPVREVSLVRDNDVNFTNSNVISEVDIQQPTFNEENLANEQQQSQNKRKKIVYRFTEEDLALLDDYNF